MTDIAVTIPRDRWAEFIAGPCEDGAARSYTIYGDKPPLVAGDYLYFVSHRRLRCALTVDRLAPHRGGTLVYGWFRPALTVADSIAGFRGWQRVTFTPRDLLAFPEWKRDGVTRFAPRFSHLGDPPPPLSAYAHGKTRSEQGGSSA